jgi:hypothetical protein
MSANKPSFGQKSAPRLGERADTGGEPRLFRRALLRATVYAGMIALSIVLWWAIIRLLTD